MTDLDKIIKENDNVEFDKLIKDGHDKTKLFVHIFVRVVKGNIDSRIYNCLLKVLVNNELILCNIVYIKKMISLLKNAANQAYKYTLLEYIRSLLQMKMTVLAESVKNTRSSFIIKQVYTKTASTEEFLMDVCKYINTFSERFPIRPRISKSKDDSDNASTPKYDNSFIENIWTVENSNQMIHRLSLLTNYFGLKLLSKFGVDIQLAETVMNYTYVELCNYYSEVINCITKYFKKVIHTTEVIETLAKTQKQIIDDDYDANITKFEGYIYKNKKKKTTYKLQKSDSESSLSDCATTNDDVELVNIELKSSCTDSPTNIILSDDLTKTLNEEPTNKPVDESTNTSIEEQTNKPVDESTNTSIEEQTNNRIDGTTNTPIEEQTNESIDEEHTSETVVRDVLKKIIDEVTNK